MKAIVKKEAVTHKVELMHIASFYYCSVTDVYDCDRVILLDWRVSQIHP